MHPEYFLFKTTSKVFIAYLANFLLHITVAIIITYDIECYHLFILLFLFLFCKYYVVFVESDIKGFSNYIDCDYCVAPSFYSIVCISFGSSN
jgi:hypothetical protein